jgi:hypothetical protein
MTNCLHGHRYDQEPRPTRDQSTASIKQIAVLCRTAHHTLCPHPLLLPRLRKSRSYTSCHPNAPLWSVTGPLYLFLPWRQIMSWSWDIRRDGAAETRDSTLLLQDDVLFNRLKGQKLFMYRRHVTNNSRTWFAFAHPVVRAQGKSA